MKIMMAAPFDVKGRYKGGIASIANTVVKNKRDLSDLGIKLIKFETCRVQRNESVEEKVNFLNIKNAVLSYFDLVKEIKKKKPDVIYFNTSVRMALLKDLLIIRHAKKKTKIPVVVHIHYADYEKIMTGKKFFDSLTLGILKKYTDKTVFLSKRTMEEFQRRGISKDKCEVIYNFSSIKCLPEEISTTENKRKFVFIGSIDTRKGIFDLMEVIQSLKGDFELHICGNCRTKEEEKRFKKDLSKEIEKLIYHGYVGEEERKSVLVDADALVLPSYGEGLPMVIMEAYSTGCVVISTRVGAIPEVLNDKNGFLLNAGDKEALGKAMKKILTMDSNVLQQMKINNLKESCKYSYQTFLKKINAVCRSLL